MSFRTTQETDENKASWGSYVALKFMRTVRWCIPVVLSCMLYYGPLNDEFRADTVSFRDIEGNNQVIEVLPNKEKEFTFIDFDTYTAQTITLTSNTKNVSSNILDQLLLRWLVNPDGMNSSRNENEDRLIQDKIDLLLKVSNPDFWAKNFYLHSKQTRINWWMWVHGRYLYFVRSLQKITNRDTLLSKFRKVSRKLQKHSHYEEIMMYPFIQDNYQVFQLAGTAEELKMALESMTIQHIPIHKQEDDIEVAFMDEKNSADDMKKLMLKWQGSLEAHFEEEESTLVHILLKLPNNTFRRYLYYISWGYMMHALESFVDYCLNLFYIID